MRDGKICLSKEFQVILLSYALLITREIKYVYPHGILGATPPCLFQGIVGPVSIENHVGLAQLGWIWKTLFLLAELFITTSENR